MSRRSRLTGGSPPTRASRFSPCSRTRRRSRRPSTHLHRSQRRSWRGGKQIDTIVHSGSTHSRRSTHSKICLPKDSSTCRRATQLRSCSHSSTRSIRTRIRSLMFSTTSSFAKTETARPRGSGCCGGCCGGCSLIVSAQRDGFRISIRYMRGDANSSTGCSRARLEGQHATLDQP